MTDYALIVGEADLRPLLDDPASMDGVIDAVEHATLRYHAGQVREQEMVDRTADGQPGSMLQIHFAADDAEISGYQNFATNPGGSLPNSRFVALLDNRTRQLLALVDYTSLSPIRVGASGGVGARYLAPQGARTAAILGSSKQARGQLQAIWRAVPSLEQVRVYSPTPEHREAFAREMTSWLELSVEPVASAEAATAGADVVAVANNSRTPPLELSWLKPGALVISVGGGVMPAEVLEKSRIVATTWDTLATREPYAAAIAAGSFSREQIAAELAPLILGEAQARRSPEEIVVFELTRLNIWAVATAHWAYRWALDSGAGTMVVLSG